MEEKLVYGGLGFLLALLVFFAGSPQAMHLTVATLMFLGAFILLFTDVAGVPPEFSVVALAILASLLIVLTREGRVQALLKLASLVVLLFVAFRVLFAGAIGNPVVFTIVTVAFSASLAGVLAAEGRVQAERFALSFGAAFREMLRRERAGLQGTFGGALFEATDYAPFMLGLFLAGGLLVTPLLWGSSAGLAYLEVLPWSLGSCIVLFIVFRRDGTISWARCVPVFLAVWAGLSAYLPRGSTPALSAGGVLAVLVVFACGYVGIGVGRIIR